MKKKWSLTQEDARYSGVEDAPTGLPKPLGNFQGLPAPLPACPGSGASLCREAAPWRWFGVR